MLVLAVAAVVVLVAIDLRDLVNRERQRAR
jgi:hypothetical protein